SVARQRAGFTGSQITRDQLADMLDPIERSLSFFLGDAIRAKACRRALESLTAPPSGGPPSSGRRVLSIKIRVEDDVARARGEARGIGAALGFTTVGQTRLMTAVSELARNIVQYAGEGQVDLTPVDSPPGVE